LPFRAFYCLFVLFACWLERVCHLVTNPRLLVAFGLLVRLLVARGVWLAARQCLAFARGLLCAPAGWAMVGCLLVAGS